MLKGLEPLSAIEPRILILGSMPSLTSLEVSEYYAYKLNRFWRIMYNKYGGSINNYEDKKVLIYTNHLALWDTIGQCNRIGSLDSAIKDVIPNDIEGFLNKNPSIVKIICNGKKSYQVFNKYFSNLDVDIEVLPSTSNANTTLKFETINNIWLKGLNFIKN